MNDSSLSKNGFDGSARLLVLPIWLLAIYAIGLLMADAATLCLWLVCAFFLFVLLDPFAQFLKRHRWPTFWTALVLVLLATMISLGIVFLFGYLFKDMLEELQQSKRIFMHSFDSLNTIWNSWNSQLSGFHSAVETPDSGVEKVQVVQGSPLGGAVGGTILHGLGSAATVLTFSLLVPILVFFLLAERDAMGRVFARAYKDHRRATNTWQQIVRATRAFFVGNLILGLITYPVFILLFWLFSVPSVTTVAALATFFNLIPFAGSVLSGFLPAVSLYAQAQTIGAPLGLYASCMAIHFFVADFVTPKILGSQVNISATTSTIALVAWGELWGGMGLILAIPLTSLIKIMFENSDFFWLQWMASLMSENNNEIEPPDSLLGRAGGLLNK